MTREAILTTLTQKRGTISRYYLAMQNDFSSSEHNQYTQLGTDESLGFIGTVRKLLDIPIPMVPLAFFFESLGLLLDTGKSIPEALLAASDVGDPELHQIFVAIAPKLRRGASLCACLRVYESRFPLLVMPLLDVGEAAGGLPGQAKRLGQTFRMQVDAERNFKFNVFDPRLIFVFMCVLVMIVTAVITVTTASSTQTGVHLAIIRDLGILAACIGLVLLFAILQRIGRLLRRIEPVRLFADTLVIAIPGIGPVLRHLSAARWARSFSTLWAAGINIGVALEISSRSTLNAHYELALMVAAAQTRTGTPLSASLRSTGMLPPNLISIITTCEQIGRFDEQLERFASDMEREALARGIAEMNKFTVRATLFYYLLAALLILSMAAK